MNFLCKKCCSLSTQNHSYLSFRFFRVYSILSATDTVNKEGEKIDIPKRIHRSPTDILHALSSTIGNDPTAAHYKYHDDPYLIPMSNIGKRTFSMSYEAGKKAAKWIKQEHSNLFKHSVADPPIKAFMPQMVYTEESEVDENALRNLIRDAEVSDAILVYSLLEKKGVAIGQDLRQDLLELVCFFNHEDTLSEDYIEERWFSQSTSGKERQRKTWKDNELAEKLFASIETKDNRSYGAIIRGMCKYYQVEKAWALFQDAQQKGVKLDVNTYNAIIHVASFLKESGEMRWELVQEILKMMATDNLKPNIGTLNSVLQTISTIGGYKQARNFALATMAEFKQLGIESSLATWYYMLIIFCRERGPVSHVLGDILNQIELKEFEIKDVKDTFFFVTAMDVCRNHLFDKDLAKRVHKMLNTGDNYDLIGDSFKESIYYRHYFALLCATEPLEIFMNTYNTLVPNVYIPEPGVMEAILKAIEMNGALEYIPSMWSHMVMFDHNNREILLQQILGIMVCNRPNENITGQADLDGKFAQIGWDVWTKIEEQHEGRSQRLSWTGQMLSDILTLSCRVKDLEKAQTVFNKLDKNQHKIVGSPSPQSIETYIQLCIEMKQPSRAISALQYCLENGFEDTNAFARTILSSMTLDENHRSKIASFLGADILKTS